MDSSPQSTLVRQTGLKMAMHGSKNMLKLISLCHNQNSRQDPQEQEEMHLWIIHSHGEKF